MLVASGRHSEAQRKSSEAETDLVIPQVQKKVRKIEIGGSTKKYRKGRADLTKRGASVFRKS